MAIRISRYRLDMGGLPILSEAISINSQSGTTYTFLLTDAGKLVDLSNAAAITLTIPTNASVAFPTGSQILIRQAGAGQVTVTPDVGVTLQSASSETKTRVQHSVAGLIKVATDTWVLFGDTTT